ncbi:MAG TPA: TonB-dependent receptor [Phenylobacterium sp.]
MARTNYFRASSFVAILLASGWSATSALAQSNDNTLDEVVVTGSFIAGTPEDAAMPVEAVTLEELRRTGSPSNLDLVKSLSEIGSVAGEANRLNAFAIGSQSVNLRALSSSRTVVLLNGRRMLEQYSASVGRFNNVALIPNAAIGRVEILKDGGATTYGADAVGGVVNYIMRSNLDGLETNLNYRAIEDSEGDWDADVSWGEIGENWNVMAVVGYQKRDEFKLRKRDWALHPYLDNPTSWSGSGSPGAYTLQRATGVPAAPFGTITPSATVASGNRTSSDVQMGLTGVVRDPNCTALGGFAGFSATPSPLCYFQFGNNSNAVEEQETWQGYAEANYRFNESVKLHLEGLYYKLDIPHTPIDNAGGLIGNFPLIPGSPTGAQQVIGTAAFAVPGSNPAVRTLLTQMRNANGTPAFGDPNTPGTQAFQIVNGGRVGLNTGTWRPFGYGPNPYREGDMQHNYSTTWRLTGELSGDFPEFAGFKLHWLGAVTYNDLSYTIEYQDMLIDRLQAALNGLGGPSCTGTTPGANGCQYFNPFSSAMPGNIFTGTANPGFVGGGTFAGYTPGQGLQNDPALVRSLFVPLSLERTGEYTIVDGIISGETPFKLWADDPISMAVGGQYRRYDEKVVLDPLSDRTINPCATVGVQVCASRTGPLAYNRGVNVTGLTQGYDRSYPVHSAFFEFQIPVFNTLVLDLSGRYEKFISDVTDVDNDVFVPAGSLRWQVTDWLALRGTAGKSFSQVNPPEDNGPTISGNIAAPSAYGGQQVIFTQRNYANTAVKPEGGHNYNVGAIVEIGAFRANVDYYYIKIEDIIRAQTTAQLIQAAVQPGATGGGALLNCSSELLTSSQGALGNQPFLQLNGPCVQGQSALNSSGAGGVGGLNGGFINFFGAQGTQPALVNGGTLETSGIDVSASYRFEDVYGGQLTVAADATHVLTYEASDYIVAGIKVADGYDGVGFLNSTTGRNGQVVAESRGSVSFNYRHGRHNLNWSTRFISSLIDDDTLTNFTETNATNENIGGTNGVVPTGVACVDTSPVVPPIPAGAGSGTNGGNTGTTVGFCSGQNATILKGQKIPAQFTTDVSYQVDLPWTTTLTVTVQNLFDEDPKFQRSFLNYNALVGSPLGRTLRVGVRKRW